MQGPKNASTSDSTTFFPILRFFCDMPKLHNAYFLKNYFREIRFFLSKVFFGDITYKGYAQEDTTFPSTFILFFKSILPKLPFRTISDIVFT